MKNKFNLFIKGLFTFVILFGSIVFVNAETKVITVNLSNTPTSISVEKAPLKYNKNFAYSFVFDDGYGEGYDIGFKYLNGGKINANNTTYPGLYYTDGAGNQIPFSAGFATTSLSSAGNDLHNGITPGYITYNQFDETYLAGWNVLHHGFGPDLGATPNYLQDILSGTAYFQSKTANNIKLQHLVIPSGLNDYAQYAFSGGMKSISQQNTNFFFDGQNNNVTSSPVNVNNLDVNKYAMYRKYYYDSAYTISTITSDVDNIALLSSGNNKFWRHSFTHRVTFGENLAGNTSWTKWKHMMDHIANNYGKDGDDSVWFAGPQDVYEYIGTKNSVSIQTGLNSNQFTITLDTNNVDEEYVRKSLSLLLNIEGATITSISYQTGAFTNYSNNNQNGLINLDRGLVYTGNLQTQVENYVSQAEQYRTQIYIQEAQTRINFLEEGITKNNFQNRLDNIEIKGKTVKINLGKSSNIRGVWNQYNGYITGSTTLTNLHDENGDSTPVSVSVSQNFTNKYPGQTTVIDGEGVYPNDVMNSSVGIYGNALSSSTGTLKIGGLINNKQYNFTLFGSTTNTQTNNRTITIYTIGSTSKELNIRQNTQNTVTFDHITPDINGDIYIHVEQKDKNRGYGLLNAVVLEEIGGTLPSATIMYSTTGVTSNDVVATLTGFNKTGITITNNSGSPYYTFTGNGSFTFNFQDSDGNMASRIATVTWINKALMVSKVTPSNNTNNVDIDQDIIIEFSRIMNKLSVENNLQITPNPGGQQYQWIGNKLIIMHDDLQPNTTYSVVLGSNTMDYNGTILGNNYGFNFTTVTGTSSNIWQLDFGYSAFTRGVWNQVNLGLTVGFTNTNLHNTNNQQTNVYIDVLKRGQDKAITGTITNNDSGIYPDVRLYNGLNSYGRYSTNEGFPEVELLLGGLDPNKTYDITFYGNTHRVEANTDSTVTIYSIGGQSVSLQTSQNTQNTVSINNVSPSNTGTIQFRYRSMVENSWTRSYLNTLIIKENTYSPNYIPIPNSESINSIKSEFLNGGYLDGIGALKSVSAGTVVGKKNINFVNNAGKLLIPTVLKSSNEMIEVYFPQGSILKKGGIGFTGILNKPIFVDKSSIVNLNNIASIVRIGDTNNGSIQIQDESNNQLNATIRMPAPNMNIGQNAIIYYSNDNGNTWDFHTTDTVEIINGEPYVEFTTNHFTDFAITGEEDLGGGSGGETGNCLGGEGTACLNLEISAVNGYCQYGKNLDLGQRDQSYSAFTMTGDFLNLSGSDSRYCDDRAGKSPWTLDISAGNLATSGDNVFTIPNTAIEIFVATPKKYIGSASFTFGAGDFANQWSNLAGIKTIFEKTSAAGSVGKLGTDGIDLRVNVPANQAIGAYQSTITIQVPVMTI